MATVTHLQSVPVFLPWCSRNLSNGCWTSQFGSASSYIEDLQVDMVRNLQGGRKSAPVVMTTSGGVEGLKKNWKSINSTRQQEQVEAHGVSKT